MTLRLAGLGPCGEFLAHSAKNIRLEYTDAFVKRKWIYLSIPEKRAAVAKISNHITDILRAFGQQKIYNSDKCLLSTREVFSEFHLLHQEVDGMFFQIQNQYMMSFDYMYKALSALGKTNLRTVYRPEKICYLLMPLKKELLEMGRSIDSLTICTHIVKHKIIGEMIPLPEYLNTLVIDYYRV